MSGAPDDANRRTLPPTPRRIDEFRRRGEVALSRDLVAISTMIGGATAAFAYSDRSLDAVSRFMRTTLEDPGAPLVAVGGRAAGTLAIAALPACGGALAGCLVTAGVQLGWPPAFAMPKFDLSRILSFQPIVNLFSPREASARALKALAKVAFVAIAGFIAANAELRRFQESPTLEPRPLGERLVSSAAHLMVYAGSALAILAVIDYVIARRGLLARMRMTPDEVRREGREQEGDPQMRRRRRARMRELARRRLGVAVKTADVVLVNPTEYAVALRYRSAEDRAPRVVGKGRGAVAERIREMARQAGIPIMAEPPLTRLIYKLVPEGREIPATLYHAVAEVLAHVYRVRRRAD